MNDGAGRCYPRDTLVGLMKLCQKYQIHLLSDEIYALSVWKNEDAPKAEPFVSVLSIDTTGIIEPDLVHVIWGMSKVGSFRHLLDTCSTSVRILVPTEYASAT